MLNLVEQRGSSYINSWELSHNINAQERNEKLETKVPTIQWKDISKRELKIDKDAWHVNNRQYLAPVA